MFNNIVDFIRELVSNIVASELHDRFSLSVSARTRGIILATLAGISLLGGVVWEGRPANEIPPLYIADKPSAAINPVGANSNTTGNVVIGSNDGPISVVIGHQSTPTPLPIPTLELFALPSVSSVRFGTSATHHRLEIAVKNENQSESMITGIELAGSAKPLLFCLDLSSPYVTYTISDTIYMADHTASSLQMGSHELYTYMNETSGELYKYKVTGWVEYLGCNDRYFNLQFDTLLLLPANQYTVLAIEVPRKMKITTVEDSETETLRGAEVYSSGVSIDLEDVPLERVRVTLKTVEGMSVSAVFEP